MPDLIRAYVDVPAQPAEVYAYAAAPTTGPLVSHAREVVDVMQENGCVAAFKTKRGMVKYVTQAPPHYLEGEYQQKQLRARYNIRFEAIGACRTRVSIDVNIQPQSLRAKLQG
ncbi:MAG TPA: hypothetical protein VLG46_13875, partial [Anaerolineae bacterium]|nr:hypothetical protein [Anaerolineae bacterium]